MMFLALCTLLIAGFSLTRLLKARRTRAHRAALRTEADTKRDELEDAIRERDTTRPMDVHGDESKVPVRLPKDSTCPSRLDV